MGKTEPEHRGLESFFEEVLVEVEGCGKDWKQGEGERLHGSCITNHLMLDSDSVSCTMSNNLGFEARQNRFFRERVRIEADVSRSRLLLHNKSLVHVSFLPLRQQP